MSEVDTINSINKLGQTQTPCINIFYASTAKVDPLWRNIVRRKNSFVELTTFFRDEIFAQVHLLISYIKNSAHFQIDPEIEHKKLFN